MYYNGRSVAVELGSLNCTGCDLSTDGVQPGSVHSDEEETKNRVVCVVGYWFPDSVGSKTEKDIGSDVLLWTDKMKCLCDLQTEEDRKDYR